MLSDRLKNFILWAFVVAGLSYIFWGADLIPDALISAGPAAIFGFLDDAVAVVALIFVLRKWKIVTIRQGKENKGLGLKGWFLFVPVVLAVLFYVFLGVDLIPDSAPYIGWVDDAIAVIAGAYIVGKLRKRLKGKK